MCQDTGTATIVGKKGQRVWTGGGDAEHLSRGIFETYAKENLRYSQTVPLTMYDEANSGHEPAGADRPLRDGRDGVPLPDGRQGRRLGEQDVPLPGDEGAPQPGEPREVPDREDEDARHRRLPALSPRLRDRRHLGRGVPQDGQARLGEGPRRPAHDGQQAGPGVPRPRARGAARSRPRARPGSAPSSAASTSRSTSGSSACRATAPRARSAWASRARPTATSWRRSTATASGSRSSSGTRAASSPSATAACATQPKVAIDLNRPMTEILAELSRHPVATDGRAHRHDRRRPRHRPREAQGAARPRRGAARSTSRTTRSTTRARPRRPRACPPARSGRRPPGRMDSLRRPLPVAAAARWS